MLHKQWLVNIESSKVLLGSCASAHVAKVLSATQESSAGVSIVVTHELGERSHAVLAASRHRESGLVLVVRVSLGLAIEIVSVAITVALVVASIVSVVVSVLATVVAVMALAPVVVVASVVALISVVASVSAALLRVVPVLLLLRLLLMLVVV